MFQEEMAMRIWVLDRNGEKVGSIQPRVFRNGCFAEVKGELKGFETIEDAKAWAESKLD